MKKKKSISYWFGYCIRILFLFSCCVKAFIDTGSVGLLIFCVSVLVWVECHEFNSKIVEYMDDEMSIQRQLRIHGDAIIKLQKNANQTAADILRGIQTIHKN